MSAQSSSKKGDSPKLKDTKKVSGKPNSKPYNPLEKRRLAESIVRELLLKPPEKLPPANPFMGAGIYVIYYRGDFPLYRPITQANKEEWKQPIYVGRAVPPGGRKGGFSEEVARGSALYKRLIEHAETIRQATNLESDHFRCRYLVVDEFWITLAESLLIETFRPLWNLVIDGFGNHDPGKGRYNSKRPYWDTLHPGRTWASRLQPSDKTLAQLQELVQKHLRG